MSLPVILRPAADADVEAIHDELEAIQAGLGTRFVASTGEMLAITETTPEVYGLVWQDARAVRLKRFRYVLYYVVFADRVEVLGILHGSRDASNWQSRR